jgi:hypothetical protein
MMKERRAEDTFRAIDAKSYMVGMKVYDSERIVSMD